MNICLKKDDKISFNDKKNANTFRQFFCNLASDLVAKLPLHSNEFGIISVRNYCQIILNLLPFKFNFSNVTEDFVIKLYKAAKPISKICNFSIKNSILPIHCQMAELKPLLKKDSTTHPRNYPLISLLPLISKIIEKVIHDQAQTFLDENKILY